MRTSRQPLISHLLLKLVLIFLALFSSGCLGFNNFTRAVSKVGLYDCKAQSVREIVDKEDSYEIYLDLNCAWDKEIGLVSISKELLAKECHKYTEKIGNNRKNLTRFHLRKLSKDIKIVRSIPYQNVNATTFDQSTEFSRTDAFFSFYIPSPICESITIDRNAKNGGRYWYAYPLIGVLYPPAYVIDSAVDGVLTLVSFSIILTKENWFKTF